MRAPRVPEDSQLGCMILRMSRAAFVEWLGRGSQTQRFGKRLLFNLVVAFATFSVLHAAGVVARWRMFSSPAFLSVEFWVRAVLFGVGFTLLGFGKQPSRVTKAYPRG